MIDQLNKGIYEAKERTIWALEILGKKDLLNKLLAEFAEVGFIKEEDKPVDGDYVKMIEPKMIDGVIGNYRGIGIKLVDGSEYLDSEFVIREKESLRVLCEIPIKENG